MNIFVVNSGSSSIKYQLFKMPSPKPVCVGLIERIGAANAVIKHTYFLNGESKSIERILSLPHHEAGLKQAVSLLTDGQHGVIKDPGDIDIVGHRVVHGGEGYSEATVITNQVKQDIKKLFSLAPLHNPPGLRGIEVAEKIFKNAKQIAVFDTAFHQTMPEYAYRYAIPKHLYTDKGIRAYGFHGTSHKYVTSQAMAYLGKPDAKLISVHLGNGCSITAVKGGKSIDTSMGFGPLTGLVMGTRSGDIDTSVILYLINELDYSPVHVGALLNKESGMLGLAGFSDMRDVKKALENGDKDAELALDIYAIRVRKYIGAYSAVLNGLDAVIFTAGVGENDSSMRERICRDLEFLHIAIDGERNKAGHNGIYEINKEDSEVKVLVVPTNEELEIATQCFRVVG